MPRELVLEMTPTCVNKTAIYHIAIETYHALSDYVLRISYCGIEQPFSTEKEHRQAIAQSFFSHLEQWNSFSAHSDELKTLSIPRNDDAPIIFFDPIYTLFHDLHGDDVVFVLDLSTLTNLSWHPPIVQKCYERAFRKLAASQALIVSISDHCTSTLRANFSIPSSQINTVPLYLRNLPVRSSNEGFKDLQRKRFLLFVGSMETRKNICGLIRAFALSGLFADGWKLVIAGGKGTGWEQIYDQASQFDGVELLGFVSDYELAWLYSNAAAFAYPSYLEGFGLPLLEAMAYGLPCLASTTGASKEICGKLGILVDPYNMASIVRGLLECVRLSQSQDEHLAERYKSRAREFSFQQYINTLKKVLPQ